MDNANFNLPQAISQADWSNHRQFVDLKTGVKMAYVEMGDPNGPALILQHGLLDSSRAWSLVAPFFCQAGYHVLIPELRGHGKSSAPDGFYTIFDYASDLKAFMDAKEVKRADFVGHSLGSMTMQAFALMFPECCRKVVLEATGPVDSSIARPNMYGAALKLLDREYVPRGLVDRLFSGEDDSAVPEDFLAAEESEATHVTTRAWRNIIGGFNGVTLEPLYRFLDGSVPIKIFVGTADTLLPQPAQQRIRELLPSAEFQEYPGVGHNIQYDIPEQFAKDVISWLKKA